MANSKAFHPTSKDNVYCELMVVYNYCSNSLSFTVRTDLAAHSNKVYSVASVKKYFRDAFLTSSSPDCDALSDVCGGNSGTVSAEVSPANHTISSSSLFH